LPKDDGSLNVSYNREWLETRIKALTVRNPSQDANDLVNQIVAVLASDSTGQARWSVDKAIAKLLQTRRHK
jgi:hypothetical protein